MRGHLTRPSLQSTVGFWKTLDETQIFAHEPYKQGLAKPVGLGATSYRTAWEDSRYSFEPHRISQEADLKKLPLITYPLLLQKCPKPLSEVKHLDRNTNSKPSDLKNSSRNMSTRARRWTDDIGHRRVFGGKLYWVILRRALYRPTDERT
jgi:hypothetical protein